MRKALLACALASSLVAFSCLGPNRAMNKVNNWNATVTDMNWLNEVLFIFPLGFVQSIAYYGDVLIFNTIQYWSGDNPIGDPGTFPESFTNG